MSKPSNARGTRDFGPLQMSKRKYVFNIIQKHFEEFGFQCIETPAIENLSVLTGKYGEEGDQLLFKILNSGDFLKDIQASDLEKGFKKITFDISEKGLRYDLTVPFARFVSMNRNDLVFPFKRYQMQPVWRADKPQKGRYREFYQCDADIVGSTSLINEAELISLFQSIFKSLNLKVNLLINSRKILTGIVDKLNKLELFTPFAVILDKLDKIGWEKVSNELLEAGFSQTDCNSIKDLIEFKGDNLAKLNKLKSFYGSNEIGLEGLNEIETTLKFVETNGFKNQNILFDFTLARGLSYYTGLIYEGKADEGSFTSSIAGGGRYDNLTAAFGMPNMSGVGISFGIERIIDVLDDLNKFPEISSSASKILLTYFDEAGQIESLKYVNQFRKAGISAEVYSELGKIKKSFEFADKKQIPFVGVIGDTEIASQKIMIKDMKKGEQNLLSFDEFIDQLD
ncbi:histidine--tRNA ligase [Sandaracinomonas limnophila]|uniref:Histidine--tRNA ligase n=1 Tax=Sandaracinomonas limnophila TaxID=1862386 RepID=A0A437PWV2_9BACT|nr:histidine--tRNA ligase [Sandaracinomonas limnophila]RVU26747.1 histidine--tRNA ligase [Sandaracinomonas limnophila]